MALAGTDAVSRELNPGFPHEWQELSYFSRHCCLPGLLQQEGRITNQRKALTLGASLRDVGILTGMQKHTPESSTEEVL